jgi:hypothetical protein|tara:strand:- start:280 stop:444 length:165 start_codon:yes stop_codon:yes gene_type:complete
MITHFINWVKGLFTPKKEEPTVEESVVKQIAEHCASHTRFRKNCVACLRIVGAV